VLLYRRQAVQKREQTERSELCGVWLDEKDFVVPFCIKAVEIGLDAWGQERFRKDEAKDYCLCLAWSNPGPAYECGIVTFAFALAPLKTQTEQRSTSHSGRCGEHGLTPHDGHRDRPR